MLQREREKVPVCTQLDMDQTSSCRQLIQQHPPLSSGSCLQHEEIQVRRTFIDKETLTRKSIYYKKVSVTNAKDCAYVWAHIYICLCLFVLSFQKCLHFLCTRGCSSTDHSPNQWRPSNRLRKLNTNLPHILYNINKSTVKCKSINCIESTYQLLFHSLLPHPR